jgi:hypothetical protein
MRKYITPNMFLEVLDQDVICLSPLQDPFANDKDWEDVEDDV